MGRGREPCVAKLAFLFYLCSDPREFPMAKQSAFAGRHTIEKLDALEKYLSAYRLVMKRQRFTTVFFDAFAGTGELPSQSQPIGLFADQIDGRAFAEGSARRALRIVPSFDRYIFVEQMKGKAGELLQLKTEFAQLAPRISVINGEANQEVTDFCTRTDWRVSRAVLFLDPFGNQVSFATIKAIALCNIDLWYLFPAGIGVNRQISNDGAVVTGSEQSLDRLYGTQDWRGTLLRKKTVLTLFGDFDVSEKQASADEATRYMIQRMKTVFGNRVLNSWLPLGRNDAHWYSLIFACGNPNQRAWEIASRIARAVMTRK
jgi:three-Cys-motif partner protein